MSADEKTKSKAIGLDVGTSRIVLARRAKDDFQYQSQRNSFVNVPFSKMTERSLEREGIPFAKTDEELVVHGNESEKFADLLGLETRRPMMGGMLNPSEEDATAVIERLVDSMLDGEGADGRPLHFSVPAAPLDGENNLTYHLAALTDLLAAKGFTVRAINEGLAVVYGELEDTNFTGIGISCGGGLCNVCVAYLSVPVVSFSVPKAGDFIDSNAAAVTGEGATRIRIEKERNFHFNGSYPDKIHQAIGIYYDDMIKAVVDGLERSFSAATSLPRFKKPLPLVLSGGTAIPKGFAERFEKVLGESDFPVPLSGLRLASDPLTTTAKGALVAALAEC